MGLYPAAFKVRRKEYHRYKKRDPEKGYDDDDEMSFGSTHFAALRSPGVGGDEAIGRFTFRFRLENRDCIVNPFSPEAGS